ncbi:cysteine-rich receptor-like protein kinase 42 isoform X2 [Lycium ferocissimum]|uniref:cysteine-rich receptor-like protein kinase 42 isoform X2 n=1 Tax=Lycium ferocissimum TaxID=112874 RepID=UPI00281604F6|nr:cysteine-rich receptor-like protein kinase 42 isoform X2 [Lycium ferocissimum]
MNFPLPKWILIFLVNYALICEADPRISEAGLVCGTNRTTPAIIIPQFVKLMEVVSQRVTDHDWGNHHVTSPNISIYALANCYQDLPHQDCLLCYAASRTRLPRCLPGKSGRIYLDGCFLRYDYYNFFNETTDAAEDKVNCSSSIGLASGQELTTLKATAGNLIERLTVTAVNNSGYAVAHLNGVYGLAQCWKTVNKTGCRECLDKASRDIKSCFPNKDARALMAGCYLRYSTQNFINDPNEGSSSERMNLGKISSSYNRSSLNYKYENLEQATNYFDPSTKVGQGGNGSVYKGTLPNGKVIAVKRLFFNTRQWVDEFFNEINLINGIEHKNLVKLLGCSIEGPESLLVYEFVTNKSLDQYIFDKNKVKILSWEERFRIIVGTAEGIDFLHRGSEIRIIHRDIKSSNVLLDENLEAKIADFGLARCLAPDKSHLSTGIAGTLGYMAPEYLVKGQLTEKADVYSYGVLVLEIVCGRKNSAFAEDSGSLLQTVWKLYRANQVTEALDPLLKGEFPAEEASKVLKVGLLCTQASVALRPSMSEVVQMLTCEDYQIPEPCQPPFLNSSLLAGGSIKSTIRSLVSNPHFKLDESSSYNTNTTGSSSMQSSSTGPHRSDEFLLKE